MIFKVSPPRTIHVKPGQRPLADVHFEKVFREGAQRTGRNKIRDKLWETCELNSSLSRLSVCEASVPSVYKDIKQVSVTQEILERPQDRRSSDPAQLASAPSTEGHRIAAFQQDPDAQRQPVHPPAQSAVQSNGNAGHKGRRRMRKWGPVSEAAVDALPYQEAVRTEPAVELTRVPSVPETQCRSFQWDGRMLWNARNPRSIKLSDEEAVERAASSLESESVDGNSFKEETAAPLQPPQRAEQCNHANLLTVPEAGSSLEPGWGLQKMSEKYFPQGIWDKPCKPPYVHVVNTVDGARRAMGLLKKLVEQDMAAAQAHSRVDDIGREFWSRRVFACDTEATGIDVTSQTACGHGRVTCWTIYGGPDVNFRRDDLKVADGDVPECVMYIDTYLGGEGDVETVLGIWSELREFLERSDIPKVWHNYSFDKHILQRHGLGISPELLAKHGRSPEQVTLRLSGFAADTMHMARLHDAVRKAPKSYSLASLTSDKTIMSSLEPNVVARSKVSMKDIFSVAKVTKTGKLSASLKELPAIHEIQTCEDPVRRWKWVDYSAFDSKSTWDLYHSLREKLQSTECKVDEVLRKGMCGERNSYTQWDLYLDLLKPFGGALTDMEQEGIYVDKEHLAEQDKKAQEDLQDADRRFRTWLRKYAKVVGQGNDDYGWSEEEVPDLVNLSSGAQIQTLLFGGFQSSKDVLKTPTKAEAGAGMKPHNVKPQLATARLFTVENPKYGEEGQKKQLSFQLTCVFGSEGTKIKSEWITMLTSAQGLPKTSATALRVMCGKPGVAKKLLKELDGTNVHAAGAAAAEALGDGVIDPPLSDTDGSDLEHVAMTHDERSEYQVAKGLGHLYMAFEDHKDGLEACAAVEALIEISAIETLRSAFLLPLQGDAVSAEVCPNRTSGIFIEVENVFVCGFKSGMPMVNRPFRSFWEQDMSKPNLQNQPALEKDRYFIRKAFRAPEGRALVVADYGQLELRILAHMTSCTSMIDAFNSGGDFHSRTAVGMFSNIQSEVDIGAIAMDKMDPNYKEGMELVKDKYGSERRKAKILNFSLAYGKTEYGLSKDFGVSLEEAKQIVDRWYNSRPEVAKWQNAVRLSAKQDTGLHRVQTMLGRHRSLPGYGKGKSRLEEGRASRAAINTPIQGSAADVVAAAMVRIHEDPFLKELGWTMLLQVHDEVIMEGPEESAEKARERLVECMRNPFIKDRARLHALLKGRKHGQQHSIADWNACYHCGMLLELSVDSSTACTWFDAK